MSTTTLSRSLAPSPDLYGHHPDPVPARCTVVSAADLRMGDVLQHAPGTMDLVLSITSSPHQAIRQVQVLRTVASGRTTAASFWIGEHARRTLHRVETVARA